MSATEGCGKVIRYLMIFFNAVFILLGIGVLAMGIYAREKKDDYNHYFVVMNDASTSSWNSFSSICIAVGILVILLSGSGLVGAVRLHRGALAFFAGFVSLIVLLEFIAAGVGYHYRNKLEDDLQNKMNTTLHKYNTTSDGKYVNAWDDVQRKLKCCGVIGPEDWQFRPSVPQSCGFAQEGCLHKLKDDVLDRWKVWAGAALAIAFVQIVAIIFSIKLYMDIGKDSYQVV